MAPIKAMLKAKEEVKVGIMSGVFTCKECGGTVHWRASPRNKHTMGRCSTEGCVEWIE
jgi:DNA replicative helicase MCM subunit Mcm2 (Cdc46/Mcm family)